MLNGMARQESDREDLLGEATALVKRIELAPAGNLHAEHVVVGFRPDGAASIYFGTDPAYHFNSLGQLRRAYADDRLLKAERGRLVAMRRVRHGGEVQLQRHELTDGEQIQFLNVMSARLRDLVKQCDDEALAIVGQVPNDVDVLGRVRNWLANCRDVQIANSPHAR